MTRLDEYHRALVVSAEEQATAEYRLRVYDAVEETLERFGAPRLLQHVANVVGKSNVPFVSRLTV
jgi:hypothetical protein